jgi:hypothetical protein
MTGVSVVASRTPEGVVALKEIFAHHDEANRFRRRGRREEAEVLFRKALSVTIPDDLPVDRALRAMILFDCAMNASATCHTEPQRKARAQDIVAWVDECLVLAGKFDFAYLMELQNHGMSLAGALSTIRKKWFQAYYDLAK